MSSKTSNCLKKAKSEENESSITSAKKTLLSEAEAGGAFSILKTKILSIQQWNEHGSLSTYELFDEAGNSLKTDEIFPGVFIRIWLKGSGKYDWVKVIDIFEAEDEFVITVQPTYDPTEENPDKNLTSHFFTSELTNNFCIVRNFKTVTFYVVGLDEKLNTNKTENTLETVRNIGAKLGSYLGIQKGEWERFSEGFINSTFEEVSNKRKNNSE